MTWASIVWASRPACSPKSTSDPGAKPAPITRTSAPPARETRAGSTANTRGTFEWHASPPSSTATSPSTEISRSRLPGEQGGATNDSEPSPDTVTSSTTTPPIRTTTFSPEKPVPSTLTESPPSDARIIGLALSTDSGACTSNASSRNTTSIPCAISMSCSPTGSAGVSTKITHG